jgi:hypothetical protein
VLGVGVVVYLGSRTQIRIRIFFIPDPRSHMKRGMQNETYLSLAVSGANLSSIRKSEQLLKIM